MWESCVQVVELWWWAVLLLATMIALHQRFANYNVEWAVQYDWW
jgi:hypothetical protein